MVAGGGITGWRGLACPDHRAAPRLAAISPASAAGVSSAAAADRGAAGGAAGALAGSGRGRLVSALSTGMRTVYSRQPSLRPQVVVAGMPFWVIRSTACCKVFTNSRTSRTIGVVLRQGEGLSGPALSMASTNLSASRTLNPSRAIFSRAAVRRLSGRRSTARAWRSVRWWAVQICCWAGVRLSSRSLLASAGWLRPKRRAASAWVQPQRRITSRRPRAVSKGSSWLRWMFSKRPRAALSLSDQSDRMAGTLSSLASLQARSRRSPAISWYLRSPTRRTLMGCSSPFCKMLTARAAISVSSKAVRACQGDGSMASTGSSSTLPVLCFSFMDLPPFSAAGGWPNGRQKGPRRFCNDTKRSAGQKSRAGGTRRRGFRAAARHTAAGAAFPYKTA